MIELKIIKNSIVAISLIGIFLIPLCSPLIKNGSFLIGEGSKNGSEDAKITPASSSYTEINSWWNETFRFRTEIEITEPGVKNRENEPVTVWMSFENNIHSRNSTRVANYDDTNGWTEMPSQVWNVTLYGIGIYIQSCSITFQVTLILSQTAIYFVYYTDNYEDIDNKTAAYQAESSMQSIINVTKPDLQPEYISAVQVSNGVFTLSMNQSAGISTFEKDGKNFHINNSLAPAPRGKVSSGLIGYWNFEEGSGTIALDSSGNNNNGIVSASWVTNGKEGNALSFNGSGSYVRAAVLRGDSVTFSMWATRNANGMLFVAGATGSGPDLWFVNNHIYWNTWDSYANPFGGTKPIPPDSNDGNFHHYVVVVSKELNIATLYYDGAFFGTAGYRDPSPVSTDFVIGGAGGTYWWSGKIDEVRMYNRAITEEEVQLLYSDAKSTIASIAVKEEGPVFSQYAINWTKAADMNTTDVLTVYNQMQMYTISRTFHWDEHRTIGNNSWQVLNTAYNNSQYYQADTYCKFFYDEGNLAKYTALLPFQSENYTIVRGPITSGGVWTSLGVFISGYSLGNSQMKFSTLRWESRKVQNSYYFIPGNYSNLENPETPLPDDDSNLTITFWEMLQMGDSYGTDHASASSNFYSTFDRLKHPLLVEVYSAHNETRFYNLNIGLKDWDDNPAVGVNVTLVNATDNASRWDFDSPIHSAISDNAGIASFTHLLAANYTVNMTYSAYEHTPINITKYSWGETNITVNKTTSLTFETIPLTRINLKFSAYDIGTGELKGDISGGNVTFYTNKSGTLDLIGSTQTDSVGNLSFYWTRYPRTQANLTFDLWFLNNRRPINITTNGWVSNLTIPLESFSTLEVGVQMDNYSTNLEVISESLFNSHFWGDLLTIRVNYTYTEALSTGNPISGATVSYQLSSGDRGTFNSSNFVDIGQGIYELILTTSALWLDLRSSTNYYMAIKAERRGYSPGWQPVPIVLKNVTTTLSALKTTIQVNWLENVSTTDARFYFYDILSSSAITGATLQYSVLNLISVTGILRDEGNGWYYFTLNSTAFTYTGSYTLTITAFKENYAQQQVSVNLLVLQIRTYIASWSNPNQQEFSFVQTVRINVTSNFVMWFNYTDTAGKGIPDAAIAKYNWKDTSGGKHLDFLTNVGNGIYSLNFSTTIRPIGQYSLDIAIQQTNYEEGGCVIILMIEPIPIVLTPFGFAQGEAVKSPQGDDLVIRIFLEDPLYGGGLTGADVQLKFDGRWYPMLANTTNPGEYDLVLSTAAYNALFAQLDFPAQISITKGNYTLAADFVFTISIAPPQLLGVPVIYWIIASVAIAAMVGIFVSMKLIQRARIPQIIKDISATRELIKKRRAIDEIAISPTKAELVHRLVEGEWAVIGIDLPAPVTKKVEESRAVPEEIEKKEASG